MDLLKLSGRGQFVPLVVGLVGLPGRGKTVLGHKLQKYLTWTGHRARVFSVSGYRRKHHDYTGHDFFRADNENAMEIRKKSHLEAMQDAERWINDGGEIAILDGTHSTMAVRQTLHNFFVKQLKCKVLFIECLIDDKDILENNIKEITQLSDDYRHMDTEKALDDIHQKVKHYLEHYKPICPKAEISYSYIKFHNAGENISVHHLDGPYQTKVLGYLSNFRPLRKTLYFSRHGESEFNLLGRIGGDSDLSTRGHKYAALLANYFNDLAIPNLQVWTSEKTRTKQTAEEINAPVDNLVPLNELNAGICEGLTYEEIQEKFPQEFAWRDQDKLRYRYPWGESYLDIISRLEPVLLELEREDNVVVISHQAVLRCILGYFLNTEPDQVPYLKVPLHTIIKLTTVGYECHVDFIEFKVECVDTYRKRPEVCNTSQ
ncbi:hypothetical protein AAG570_003629 [Ranatra chinensis]|uniref:6-phosphofructo-2-kinase domain-containing protein n=1 Tax=Ranatra chinensis TaxID=642074 RepID=A0ABD0Y6G4_9HEMI